MNYERRIILILVLLVIVIVAGTFGYAILEKWSIFDALYMTIISLTTVGYGEIHPLSYHGRIFTIGLLLLGGGLVTLSIGTIAEFMVEGRLRQILGRRKMAKKIDELYDHYIICGYGRLGSIIGRELKKTNIPFVVVDRDLDIVETLSGEDILAVQGNATEDSILLKAGIKNAKGVVTVLRTDADNVYVSLTSRVLNPDLFILARAEEEGAEQKLLLAGADKVISPYSIGGHRMALALLKPAIVDFIELATHSEKMEIRMEAIEVKPKARIKEMALKDIGITQDLGIIVIAIKKKSGEMVFNPAPNTLVHPGDHLIVLGDVDQLQKLEDLVTR